MVDKAIAFIADAVQVDPEKPFFMYFCTGAMHAPHHVPQAWSASTRGSSTTGWDVYRETVFARQKELGVDPVRCRTVAATILTSSRGTNARPMSASSTPGMMEVYAGFLEHTDFQIGRLLDFLKHIDAFDNTLIVALSDNGASSEGGPDGMININMWHNNLASSVEDNLAVLDELGGPNTSTTTPGAGHSPAIRHSVAGSGRPIAAASPIRSSCTGRRASRRADEIRSQYVHAIDLVPTVLDCLDVDPPQTIRGVTQSPLEGVTFAHSFDDNDASQPSSYPYFEMMGHRSIYHDGWRAVCPWPGPSFAEAGKFFGAPLNAQDLISLDDHGWELYHVDEDLG